MLSEFTVIKINKIIIQCTHTSLSFSAQESSTAVDATYCPHYIDHFYQDTQALPWALPSSAHSMFWVINLISYLGFLLSYTIIAPFYSQIVTTDLF